MEKKLILLLMCTGLLLTGCSSKEADTKTSEGVTTTNKKLTAEEEKELKEIEKNGTKKVIDGKEIIEGETADGQKVQIEQIK